MPKMNFTLLIGDVREPAPPMDINGQYGYFTETMTKVKEMARLIFSLRPEVTAIDCECQDVHFVLTPAVSFAVEPSGYKDSPGY
jgi:hypothetical protein